MLPRIVCPAMTPVRRHTRRLNELPFRVMSYLMAEQRLKFSLIRPGPVSSAGQDAAARAREMFADAVKRIASESTVGNRIEGTSELELLEAATALTTGRR